MVLKEKEKQAIKDLQTLEQACIDKYGKYAAQAKDTGIIYHAEKE